MNRIDEKLKALALSSQKMLSPYITAGDPETALTLPLMHALVEAGASILEIGMPFSDPMAEGPVIQAAMERALAQGIDSETIFSIIAQFRSKDKTTPIVLMGYMNPIEQYGEEAFAKRAAAVGVDGIIVVDLPPEEGASFFKACNAQGLYNIFLCSPTTSATRMALISQKARGYLYYVSLKGVTGAGSFDLRQVQTQYKRHKSQTDLPMMVGFGIKTPEMAFKVAEFADGVIVGAALIEQIYTAYRDKKDPLNAGRTFIANMRAAMDKEEASHDH